MSGWGIGEDFSPASRALTKVPCVLVQEEVVLLLAVVVPPASLLLVVGRRPVFPVARALEQLLPSRLVLGVGRARPQVSLGELQPFLRGRAVDRARPLGFLPGAQPRASLGPELRLLSPRGPVEDLALLLLSRHAGQRQLFPRGQVGRAHPLASRAALRLLSLPGPVVVLAPPLLSLHAGPPQAFRIGEQRQPSLAGARHLRFLPGRRAALVKLLPFPPGRGRRPVCPSAPRLQWAVRLLALLRWPEPFLGKVGKMCPSTRLLCFPKLVVGLIS